ncbi:hypothetical protein NDU88_005534 [Pleurodeles waltl]|uniref:Uncharacterized protein n=1 Tax=Pleurodeles waltl TaxID=8319 RepID=A0AAV7N0U5_PLEWA|nr:hypothetical protein NDU88_005534 [Pleurodeles waltl]
MPLVCGFYSSGLISPAYTTQSCLTIVLEDPKQCKFPFQHSKELGQQDTQTDLSNGTTAHTILEQLTRTAAIMVELQTGFCSTDAWFDSLTIRTDHMGEPLDRQNTLLDSAEELISGLHDRTATTWKRLERVEKILKAVAVKNEDLEARSCCNNIQILGIAESTDMG